MFRILCQPALQDILVLNITRAVQLSVDIGSHVISDTEQSAPQTMGNVFVVLEEIGAISSQLYDPMKKAVGFRNIAVHQYEANDWNIIYAVCEQSVTGFGHFAR